MKGTVSRYIPNGDPNLAYYIYIFIIVLCFIEFKINILVLRKYIVGYKSCDVIVIADFKSRKLKMNLNRFKITVNPDMRFYMFMSCTTVVHWPWPLALPTDRIFSAVSVYTIDRYKGCKS